MAATDGLTFEGTFNHAGTGLFKNNTAGDIGADDVRTLVTAVKESYFNRIDDAYTAPFPQVTASGTDTYTATLSPAITAYAAGQKFQILFTNANTGAATLNLNTVGALAITKNGATALAAGDIPAGSIKILAYDGTQLQLIGNVESQGSFPNGLAAVDTTGTAISFAVPQIYGSVGTPETGNITIVTTGLVKGMTQLLIHNNGSEPTYGAEIQIISGAYTISVDNYIMLMAVSSSLILATISQELV